MSNLPVVFKRTVILVLDPKDMYESSIQYDPPFMQGEDNWLVPFDLLFELSKRKYPSAIKIQKLYNIHVFM